MNGELFGNKNIYIFGGSSGIGLSTARQFAGMGSRVFIFARDEARLEDAAALIEQQGLANTRKVYRHPVNITDPRQVDRVIRDAAEHHGSPDILINCAGRAIPEYFEGITHEQFEETIRINLLGIRNTIFSALPYMKKSGGAIVNTSSVAGFLGVFGYTDYAASKFAVIGFSEALGSELKRYHIKVSVLCPPDTRTPGYDIENKTKPEETRAISKGAGLLEPDQVARALVKGIAKGRKMIIPGAEAKLTWYLKRWCPWLVDTLMDRTILKTQKKRLSKRPVTTG